MATLIPALGRCTARMAAGERRLAQRLEDKLDGNSTLQTDPHTSKKTAHPCRCLPGRVCQRRCRTATRRYLPAWAPHRCPILRRRPDCPLPPPFPPFSHP